VWYRPVRDLAAATAQMEDRAAAEAVVRRELANDPINQNMLNARVAWLYGDFSEAARRWALVTKEQSIWAAPARLALANARYLLGVSTGAPNNPLPNLEHRSYLGRVWMAAPPSPAEWRSRNRSAAAAMVYDEENIVAAKLMLNAGRARELAATFDGPSGLLGIRAGEPLVVSQIHEAPLVALALKHAGRPREADELLRRAAGLLRGVYARGKVPFWFDAEAAAVWAVQGETERALDALERAITRGWSHAGSDDLPRLAAEPVFRGLHRISRFEALRARLDASLARERAELLRLKL
jgi:hypothetical protein